MREQQVSFTEIIARICGVPSCDVIDSNDAREAFVNAANGLKSKELIALTLRSTGLTSQECAKAMGLSLGRFRNSEAMALRKLRHPRRIVLIHKHVKHQD